MRRRIVALLVAAAVPVAPAVAAPADDFAALLADHWRWWLGVNPVQARAFGVHDHDGRLGDPSLADQSPLTTPANYASYVARLEVYPAFNRAAIDVTRTALAGGFVQPCAAMRPFGARSPS